VEKISKYELNTMTKKEIELRYEELLEEYENLRFQKVTKQLDNPVILRIIKKEIARLKTILREFELGIREEAKKLSEEEKS